MTDKNTTSIITKTSASEAQLEPTIEVIKSGLHSLDGLLPSYGSAQGGDLAWPISPHLLAQLYQSSAEHARAIHIKAQSCFGNGIMGARAHELDALTDASFSDLCFSLELDIGTFGNAFLQVIYSDKTQSRIVHLRRLPAKTITRMKGKYKQTIITDDGSEKTTLFSPSEIIHLRDQCPLGGPYALPSWAGIKDMLGLSRSAIAYNDAFFQNNAMPEYAIIMEGGNIDEAQRKSFREYMSREHRGVGQSHRTFVMNTPEGVKVTFQKLTTDVKDGDFLKLLDAVRDRIPIAHGVPPRMMGIVSAGQLGGGGEATAQLFVFENTTCKPKRRRMLDQLRPILSKLGLRPAMGQDALADDEVAFRGLDLTPPKDDADTLPALVGAGILSADEARSLLPLLQRNGELEDSQPVEKSTDLNFTKSLSALLMKL